MRGSNRIRSSVRSFAAEAENSRTRQNARNPAVVSILQSCTLALLRSSTIFTCPILHPAPPNKTLVTTGLLHSKLLLGAVGALLDRNSILAYSSPHETIPYYTTLYHTPSVLPTYIYNRSWPFLTPVLSLAHRFLLSLSNKSISSRILLLLLPSHALESPSNRLPPYLLFFPTSPFLPSATA